MTSVSLYTEVSVLPVSETLKPFEVSVDSMDAAAPVMPRTAAHLAGKPERFDRLPADAETIKAYVRAFAEG